MLISPRSRYGKSSISMALLLMFVALTFGQNVTPLSNLDIVSMVRDKTSVAVIKATIKASPASFDTSATAIQQLRKLGVSETLILAVIERQGQAGAVATVVQTAPASAAQTRGAAGPAQTTAVTDTAQPAQPAAPLGPKRPGIPRIGIVTTTTTAPTEQDEAIRAQFYEVLYGNRETSSADAVLMREKLDRNITSEAAFTHCDYLLFVSLDSTIESATKRQSNFFQKGIQAAAQGLGATSKLTSPVGLLTGITYKSYQMADSLQTSTTLLDTVAEATKKNDKIGINYKLVKVGTGETVLPQTLKEITAQRRREPILQNLLIQLGNEIVNSIPVGTPQSAKK